MHCLKHSPPPQMDADLGGAPSREVLAGSGVVSGSSGWREFGDCTSVPTTNRESRTPPCCRYCRRRFKDGARDRLTHVGQNAVGIMFRGCLVILPADVAVKILGYLRPVGVPRRPSLVTGKGTHVYDLRKDLQGMYGGEWTEVSFDQAARDFWEVVGEHRFPCLRRALIFAKQKTEAHAAVSADIV